MRGAFDRQQSIRQFDPNHQYRYLGSMNRTVARSHAGLARMVACIRMQPIDHALHAGSRPRGVSCDADGSLRSLSVRRVERPLGYPKRRLLQHAA